MINLSGIYNFFYSAVEHLAAGWSHLFGFLSFKIYLALLLAANFLLWAFAFMFERRLSDGLINLHYNVDFGVDLVGNSNQIFIMPALGMAVAAINLFWLFFFVKNSHLKFLIQVFLAAALAVNILLLIALGPIHYINFR
jgi:hypothetical protein